MFENMPQVNVPQTAFVKRRRLITTEMARSRLETGEWQLRTVPGASVRCRFFYEIYDGEVPLNTLSCKICGATYSVQSRSHYREHVRRRHSEVYCVRSRASQNTVVSLDNASGNSNALFDDSMNADSPYNGEYVDGECEYDIEEEEDPYGGFSLPFNNDNSLAGTEAEEDCMEDPDDGGSGVSGDNGEENADSKSNQHMPRLNANGKVRRLVTTDTATVLYHLEVGDWQRKAIPGVSIRSRFFVEIVEGDKTLNILLCKVCGSTYSAQSRSHCVEHVKKRHQSILEGHANEPDFEYEMWRETRRPSPSSLQAMPVPYTLPGNAPSSLPTSSSRSLGNGKSSLSVVRPKVVSPINPPVTTGARKRKRMPEIITGPDQTIETPSFEDVLQSIASQVLLNGGDEDMKFNLDDFNKNIKNGNKSLKDEIDKPISAKRREFDVPKMTSLSRDDTESPPLLTGGVNDQLIALSEMGFAEAEQQRQAEEAAAAANEDVRLTDNTVVQHSEKTPTSSVSMKLVNNGVRSTASQSSSQVKTATPPQLLAEDGSDSRNGKMNGSLRSVPASIKKSMIATTSGQKLNHQQLIIASRTAAMLSGNGDDTPSDGDLSPKENGHSTSPAVRGGREKDLYGEVNGYFPPFSGNTKNYVSSSHSSSRHHSYPHRPSHSQYQQSSNNISSGASGNYYKAQPSSYWTHRVQQQSHQHGFNHPGQLPGPRGYDDDRFSRGQSMLLSGSGNSRSMNTANSAGNVTLNGSLQSPDDSSLCRGCKTEIPNIVKGLNQMNNCIKDLTDVLRLALSQPVSADYLLNNNPVLSRALRRLDSVQRTSNNAIQNLTASPSRYNTPPNTTAISDRSKLVAINPRRAESTVEQVKKSNVDAMTTKRQSASMESAPNLQRMDCEAADAPETVTDAEPELEDDEEQNGSIVIEEDENEDCAEVLQKEQNDNKSPSQADGELQEEENEEDEIELGACLESVKNGHPAN